MSDTPNPGSEEALSQGCLCPVLDNGHGKGAWGGAVLDDDGNPTFWINASCPLHGGKKCPTPTTSEPSSPGSEP